DRGVVDLSADTPETGIRLAKLHGSVDWSYDEDYVLEELDGPTTRPAIIFGAGNKLQSFGPYLDLLLAFRDRLRVTSHLVVSGYTLRDDHLNQLILDWLEPGAARRVTVCDPSLDSPDIGRNLNQANSRGPGFRGTYVMARFDVVKQTTG